jgi:hypothetical protein
MYDNAMVLPAADVSQPEDHKAEDWNDRVDDSEVPIKMVLANVINEVVPKGYSVGTGGGLEAAGEGEGFGDSTLQEIEVDHDDGDKKLGHGKHQKQANRLYQDFWHHDSGDADEEI